MISKTALAGILAGRTAPPIKVQEILNAITQDAVKDPEILLILDAPMETRLYGTTKILVRGAKRIMLCTGENAKEKAETLKKEICGTLSDEICEPLFIKRAITIDGKTVWKKVPYTPVINIAPLGAADARLNIDAAIATHQKPQEEIIDMILIANGRLRGEVDKVEAELRAAQSPQDIDLSKSIEELKFQKMLYDQHIADLKTQLQYQQKECDEKTAKNNELITKIKDCGDEKLWLSRRSGASWRLSFFDGEKRRQVSCGDFVIFYTNSDIDQAAFANALGCALSAQRTTRARTDILHFDNRDKGYVGGFVGIGGRKNRETETYFMVRRIDPERVRF